MWDLEIGLAHAVISPSAGLVPPANSDQRLIPIKGRVAYVCLLRSRIGKGDLARRLEFLL